MFIIFKKKEWKIKYIKLKSEENQLNQNPEKKSKRKNLHKLEKTGRKKWKTTSSRANRPAQLTPHAGGAGFRPANGRSIGLAAENVRYSFYLLHRIEAQKQQIWPNRQQPN
jgi:hypothetical protein